MPIFGGCPRRTPSRASDGNISIRRYWRLPEVPPVDYRRPQECLDHFREVFDAAVSDRLRSDSAGILLSGGLDSPTVAASARRVLTRRNSPFDFRAYTHVHDSLIPHEERHYAGLVAQALNLPIEFLDGDNCHLYDTYDDPQYRTPEPNHFPMGFRNANPFKEIARWSRTVLTGFGGDPTLASLLTAHFRRLSGSAVRPDDHRRRPVSRLPKGASPACICERAGDTGSGKREFGLYSVAESRTS